MYYSTLYRALDHQKHKLVFYYFSEMVLGYRISYVSCENLLLNLYICLNEVDNKCTSIGNWQQAPTGNLSLTI